jgi:hypothetical protein
MIGNSILSRFSGLLNSFKQPPVRVRPDLHSAWLHPEYLPGSVQKSGVVIRCLDLLGPLDWDHIPERNLQRNWGQPTIPYAAFIPACLLKLNEGKESMGDLRLFLCEHPELAWLLGFSRSLSNPHMPGFAVPDNLPTTRHLTRLLRELPNAILQFLLADTVRLIRQALTDQDIALPDCISLDTKHILAWVKENNPKAYVEERFDKTKQPVGDPDCKLGCKRRKKGAEVPTAPPTPTKNSVPAKSISTGEFYWGYGSGVVVIKVPGWGEFVLAEMTQTFDKPDVSYFFPLMALVEQRLGHKPHLGTFDAAFDAWYV